MPAVLQYDQYTVGCFQITLEWPSPGHRNSYPYQWTTDRKWTAECPRCSTNDTDGCRRWRRGRLRKPGGPRQICGVCHMRCPAYRALRLQVDARFLLRFCPCGFHNVFPYPVLVHKLDCFAGEVHTVDQDCFPQHIDTIRPVIKKATTLAA